MGVGAGVGVGAAVETGGVVELTEIQNEILMNKITSDSLITL